MKTIIGIDPGQAGGLVIMSNKNIHTLVMPVSGKEINVNAIVMWLVSHIGAEEQPVAYIEKVHSMPDQGVASSFKFGFNVGILHGILRTLGISLQLVTPQAWKKEVLSGTKKDKDAAKDYCARVYPDISLLATERSKVAHDGIADALCIAEYGYRMENNVITTS